MKLIIRLFVLIVVSNFASTEFVPRINCSSVVDVNCECSFLHEFEVGSFRSFVELICVAENDFRKRIVIKNEKDRVSIECQSENAYDLIPKLNIGIISRVTVDCPSNTETPIKNITDRMGINNFNHLTITAVQFNKNLFKADLNITRLDVILAQNGIEFFPTKFLNSLSNLEFFDYKSQDGSGTALIDTAIFQNQSKLKSVQLADVVIKKLSKEIFAGALSMNYLEFRYSVIELITDDAFENLSELTTLKFYFTHIKTLPNSLFREHKKLKHFYSKSNTLITGDLLANLTSLITVDISLCESSMPSNIFVGSSNIKMISLTHTHTMGTMSSEIFTDQIELTELDLSYNSLFSLPGTIFNTNKKLEKLNLGYNALQSIPENLFTSTELLRELNLEFNRLQQMSDDILPESLTWLRLNGNKLKTLDDRILNRLNHNTGKLKYLSIQSNAFECECGTSFIRLIELHRDKLNVNKCVCWIEGQFQIMKTFLESCR